MRGGVVNKIDDEPLIDQIHRILGHPLTKIEYISRGVYGEVFRVLYPDEDSGFEDENEVNVKVFILKVQGIDMRLKHISEPEPNRSEEEYDEDDQDFYPYSHKIKWETLEREVNLQQQIYTRALDKHLMPPCPAILFYEAITAEKFETFAPGQLVYKDGDRLENVEEIKSRDFKAYRMGIILMEYVDAADLSNIPHERYVANYKEIESNALRTYCTALQCGVLQGDPKPQNFLLKEDNNVVLIDFGIAKKLIPSEINMFDKLIEQAEQGNSTPLRAKLTQMERPDYKCLDILIFRPTTYTSGKVVYPTLAPAIHLSEEIALQYKSGICKMRSILPPREKLSTETIAEAKRIDERNAQIKAKESKRPSETETEPEVKKIKCEKEEKEEKGWCSVMGGKRHTKYVGTRRHKKTRTRRKV